MRIQCLQHVPFEGPSGFADWAKARGHSLRTSHLYDAQGLPAQSELDWLIVMGGPMGVHDHGQHPWLVQEQAFIREAIDAGKNVVGVCLGAQLIARALGASVTRNPHPEIGWFPIELTETGRRTALMDGLPARLQAFHWHGDTFDLPEGAVHLARSEACAHQGFLYGRRVLALQCHLEATPAGVAALVEHCGHEIGEGPYSQRPEELLAAGPADFSPMHEALFAMLDRLASLRL